MVCSFSSVDLFPCYPLNYLTLLSGFCFWILFHYFGRVQPFGFGLSILLGVSSVVLWTLLFFLNLLYVVCFGTLQLFAYRWVNAIICLELFFLRSICMPCIEERGWWLTFKTRTLLRIWCSLSSKRKRKRRKILFLVVIVLFCCYFILWHSFACKRFSKIVLLFNFCSGLSMFFLFLRECALIDLFLTFHLTMNN